MKEPAERHLQVARTARYWVLGEGIPEPAEVWIVLHGYRQLARRFLRRFQGLADGTRVIVAPEGLSRFYVENSPARHGPTAAVGAAWMTREDREHEITDYVGYLDALFGRVVQGVPSAPKVTVLGFSQGVATAARWSVLGAVRPTRLVFWGDLIPPDLPLDRAAAAWKGVSVLRVRGDRDSIFADGEGATAEDARLSSAGISSAVLTFPGGHEIDPRMLAAVAAHSSSDSNAT